MRLHIPTLGLATSLITVAVATGISDTDIFTFLKDEKIQDARNFGNGHLIFSSATIGTSVIIRYETTQMVNTISLCKWQDGAKICDLELQPLPSVPQTGTSEDLSRKRQNENTVNEGRVQVPICVGETSTYCDQVLYLQFSYGTDESVALWNSTALALTNNGDKASIPIQTLIKELQGFPTSPGSIIPTSTDGGTTVSTPSESAGAPNSAGSPSSDDGDTSTGASYHPSNNDGGGLSTGAIAGIAVACAVVGISAIGLGIFFCIRRRKASGTDKTRDLNVSYGSDAGMRGIVTEKVDTNGFSQSSPQSAFADDGGRLHDRGGVSMDTSAYDQHSPTGYPRYAEGGAIPIPHSSQNDLRQPNEVRSQEFTTSRSATGSTTAGGMQSPSPPASARYAHLVEEGMTPDEIERLEEEERQLDMAIQEAGERRQRQ